MQLAVAKQCVPSKNFSGSDRFGVISGTFIESTALDEEMDIGQWTVGTEAF